MKKLKDYLNGNTEYTFMILSLLVFSVLYPIGLYFKESTFPILPALQKLAWGILAAGVTTTFGLIMIKKNAPKWYEKFDPDNEEHFNLLTPWQQTLNTWLYYGFYVILALVYASKL